VGTIDIQSGAALDDTNCSDQDFSQQDLSDCIFTNCEFSGCSFRACDLSRVEFVRCQFNDTSAERPADFSQAELREAKFSDCNLTVVDFIRANGYDLTFEHCQMQGADLSKADFRLPIGTSELAALTLKDCNFSYGNLANTNLVGCTLSNVRCLEACFDYCDMTDADLSGSEFHNINAVGLSIQGADLRGCSFNNIDPREIDLTGVRIYFSQLAALLEPLGIIVEDDPEL
jgi:fluoroquinolone resistance protein